MYIDMLFTIFELLGSLTLSIFLFIFITFFVIGNVALGIVVISEKDCEKENTLSKKSFLYLIIASSLFFLFIIYCMINLSENLVTLFDDLNKLT